MVVLNCRIMLYLAHHSLYISIMQQEVKTSLEELGRKIKRLKSRNERLESENESLRQSVFMYLEQLEAAKNESKKNKQDILIQQIGKNADKKSLQKEIDKYIQLIDKCMATLRTKM